MAYKKILATFCHLPEYPTCPKAMSWYCIRSTVELTWPVEPFFQYGSPPWGGLWFLGDWIGRLTRVRPFSSDKGLGESSTIPKFCLGLPSALHRTVLPYYDCQVREAYYFAAAYSIEEPFIRAIFAEERDHVLLAAVLNFVKRKEESSPVMMYCFLGLLPDAGETV